MSNCCAFTLLLEQYKSFNNNKDHKNASIQSGLKITNKQELELLLLKKLVSCGYMRCTRGLHLGGIWLDAILNAVDF